MAGSFTEQIWAHWFFVKQKGNVPEACNSNVRVWENNIYWVSKNKTAKNFFCIGFTTLTGQTNIIYLPFLNVINKKQGNFR